MLESVDSCYLGDIWAAHGANTGSFYLSSVARMWLSGLREGSMILASAMLCCMVVKPGPLETKTLTDYKEMKEEFLEEYVMSGRMKELVVLAVWWVSFFRWSPVLLIWFHRTKHRVFKAHRWHLSGHIPSWENLYYAIAGISIDGNITNVVRCHSLELSQS